MIVTELIEELSAMYDACSDTATAAVLDQTILKLEIYLKWKPIETVPSGQRVLLWSPEYGVAMMTLTGMDAAARVSMGYTHWLPVPYAPEKEE